MEDDYIDAIYYEAWSSFRTLRKVDPVSADLLLMELTEESVTMQ